MTALESPAHRHDLYVVTSPYSNGAEGLTPLERQRLIRNQLLFLDELESHGAKLTSLTNDFKGRSSTFEEMLVAYTETLTSRTKSIKITESLQVVIGHLSPLLNVYNACQGLSEADEDSEVAKFKKKKIQKEIIDSDLISVQLKMALLVALDLSTPHIEGLDMDSPENTKLFFDQSFGPEPPLEKEEEAIIIPIHQAKSYRERS